MKCIKTRINPIKVDSYFFFDNMTVLGFYKNVGHEQGVSNRPGKNQRNHTIS